MYRVTIIITWKRAFVGLLCMYDTRTHGIKVKINLKKFMEFATIDNARNRRGRSYTLA
jgi:hypothetical protein